MPSLDPDTLFYGSDERRADFLTDDTPEEYPELASTVSVTAAEPKEVDGSSVQFYDVNVGGRAVEKRFKEFDTIHRLLRSAYADAPELLAKIPKLPNKTFGRTSGDEFVERRRAGLEELMQVSTPQSPPPFPGLLLSSMAMPGARLLAGWCLCASWPAVAPSAPGTEC